MARGTLLRFSGKTGGGSDPVALDELHSMNDCHAMGLMAIDELLEEQHSVSHSSCDGLMTSKGDCCGESTALRRRGSSTVSRPRARAIKFAKLCVTRPSPTMLSLCAQATEQANPAKPRGGFDLRHLSRLSSSATAGPPLLLLRSLKLRRRELARRPRLRHARRISNLCGWLRAWSPDSPRRMSNVVVTAAKRKRFPNFTLSMFHTCR